jgi:hypothetical protein
MKKKLLVVGDSFMLPDSEYLEQHWSEMLPEYDVLMYSQSGSSNGMIAHQFFNGLSLNPDAVVVGFSSPERIEFRLTPAPQEEVNNDRWATGSHPVLNSVQKLAADYYATAVCQDMQFFKNLVLARSVLLTLEKKKVPFAYTCNLLFNHLNDQERASQVDDYLGEFKHRCCPTNLATYPKWKASPGFHTDNPAWQHRFAQEVREILQRPVDFFQQIK